MKRIFLLLTISLLSGCAVIQSTGVTETTPILTGSMTGVKKEFDHIQPPTGKPISVAVYSFMDKTGQRRPQANVASLSTAVTQGAETFLIQALQNVGRGQWFEVVERVGIDNLTKERTIIRQMREAYEGKDARPLMPMQFAGMIIEGGIVGYDTSTNSGGAGMRVFGIGKQTQWSQDTVTVSLRAVSVNTGKVLMTVTVQKTIMSSADSLTALKFYDAGTKSFEAEAGLTINEPGTYAVKAATEMAVVELIKEGQRKGIWDFKQEVVTKQEEKKDVVVPQKTETERAAEVAPTQTQSDSRKNVEGSKTETRPVTEEAKVEVKVNLHPVMYLNKTAFLYKTADEKSQKSWQLVKGTELKVVPAENDWMAVVDKEGRKGFVKKDVLTSDKP